MAKSDLQNRLTKLQQQGLDPEREKRFRDELEQAEADHNPPAPAQPGPFPGFSRSIYSFQDQAVLQRQERVPNPYTLHFKSLDDLLERDRQREEDGFPRKIKVGKLIKPGKGGKGKVVVVPSTEEEKLIHDPTVRPPGEGGSTGGTGSEEEGDILGEQPVRDTGGEPGAGPGQGEGEGHDLDATAYELGRALTEKFQLPNLREKGKKRSFTRYTYDLTDRNRGSGQVLDKKATLRQIVETNIALGNLPSLEDLDPVRFLIAPKDKVYRVLSPEKDYEPQALVFFVRDYSGSMAGKVTELVVTQHVLIYSWLLFQYGGQVESRFILHDTEAKEVSDFYTYYNSRVAGGTEVASALKLVNEIVAKDHLDADYNIYVFHGTDGDDWDTGGDKALPEIMKILSYASRMGITIAEHSGTQWTEVARYMENSGLLRDKPDLIRMDIMSEDADEARIIEGIKKLIS
ncbi:DUF444 family protein [Geomesophilobacter sediminis]|uniref:DUF444 family protein n=1 Tax=Geomesophilobacter sediminis TaxID=2798584 RepID=A0A8J7M0R5_9BACT|nr:DUF444 family protein [Geomesophilobacter sediminis]MBJ6726484.1 DUF444 family protein [Geomesophilobacter sediminis]